MAESLCLPLATRRACQYTWVPRAEMEWTSLAGNSKLSNQSDDEIAHGKSLRQAVR